MPTIRRITNRSFWYFSGLTLLFVGVFGFGFLRADALDVPAQMSFQGRVLDGSGDAVTGTHDVKFKIYDALTSGNLLFSETHSSVSITNGFVALSIGSETALSLPFDEAYYLSIEVDTDGEMSPRLPINSSGYAIISDNTLGFYATTTAPASPAGGDVYFDNSSGDDTAYIYDGQGWIDINAGSTTTAAHFFESNISQTSGTTTLKATTIEGNATATSLTITGDTTSINTVSYTWPSSDGTSGQVLHTNGSGVLSWAADDSGGGGSALLAFTDNDDLVRLATTTDNFLIGGTHTATTSASFFFNASERELHSANTLTVTTATGDLSLNPSGDIDLNSNTLLNIGASGTDFSGSGGLTLADQLTISSGGASIAGNIIQTSGTTTLLHTTIAGSATATDLTINNTATIAGLTTLQGNLTQTSGTTTLLHTTIAGSATATKLTVSGDTTVLNTVAYTWPSSDGTSGQVLKTNASGVLTWSDDSTGGGGSSPFNVYTDGDDLLRPATSTDNFLIGGVQTATTSAAFFFDVSDRSIHSANTLTVTTAAGDLSLNPSGDINLNNNTLLNIGASGTDFSGSGGLTLADQLVISANGLSVTGASSFAGNISQSSGTTTLLHTTIDGTSTTTGAALFQAGINQTGGTTTLQATNIEGAFVVGNGLTVGSGSVSLPAGSLATTTLSNAIISIGGINFPLGHTDATPAFDLSDAVSLNATQLTSGTVPSARLDGAYTSITGVGTLSGLTIGGNIIQSSGTTTLLHTTIAGSATATDLTLTNGLTVSGGSVSFPAGSLATTTLASGIVTIGGVQFPLGESIAQPAFDLTSAHSLSLTSGVSGVLPLANGGTNKSLTADAGGIFYSDGDSFEILADGASGSFLTSGGTGAPTWTATTSIVVATSTLSLNSQLLDNIDSASFLRSDTDDTFTGALTIAGNVNQSSGTTTLLHTTIAGSATATDLTITGGLTLSTDLSVANGGTGASTFTDGGILLGSGTGAITAMSVLADGSIVVGDGSTDPVALAAFTSSTGLLKHESGGVELDISSIGVGDILAGASAGTLEIVDGGSASDGDVLTIQADGTANWEAAAGGGGGDSPWTVSTDSTSLSAATTTWSVGIGTTTPAGFLSVATTTAATGHAALIVTSSEGLVGIGTSTPGYMLDVKSRGDLTARIGNQSSDTLVVGGGLGKLTAGTIDPIYVINGERYATYVTGSIGQNEDVNGSLSIDEPIGTMYKKTIFFDALEPGDDLWLFSKATNLRVNIDQISVLLTPAGNATTWYEIHEEEYALTIFSSVETEVSFKMTAPRFDYEKWPNYAQDQYANGFVINDPDADGSSLPALTFETMPEPIDIGSLGNGDVELESDGLVGLLTDNLKLALASLSGTIEAAGEWIFDKFSAQEAQIESATVQNLQIHNGFTIFDVNTGEPYCVRILSGQMVHTQGECAAAVTSDDPAPDQGGGSNATSTSTGSGDDENSDSTTNATSSDPINTPDEEGGNDIQDPIPTDDSQNQDIAPNPEESDPVELEIEETEQPTEEESVEPLIETSSNEEASSSED